MDRLKVLFVTTWYPTKTMPVQGVFVREHAKAARVYNDVVVLHCGSWDRDLKGLWRMEQEHDERLTEGIPTYRVWHRRLSIPMSSYLLYIWGVYQAFRRISAAGFGPQVIHAHVYQAGVPTIFVGKLNRIPVVITEHSSAFPRRLLRGQETLKARFAFRSADRVLPVSYALQRAIEDYGIRAAFQVVRNVVDTQLFFPPSCTREPDRITRLLFVGRLVPIKGIPYLLRALVQLRQQTEKWHLDIVGDGPSQQDYERLATDLGLADKVTFQGFRSKDKVAEFMRDADLFVLPSLWENLPCVIIEAMASGLPIVSTLVGGIPELIDAEAGILVPPRDATMLSTALAQMLQTQDQFDRHTLAEKARQFSPEIVGHLMDTIYRDCVQQ